MADDLGPILPDPGPGQAPAGDAGSTVTDVPAPPSPPPPSDDSGDAGLPPVDGLPIDDPLGAPGAGMDVPTRPTPARA